MQLGRGGLWILTEKPLMFQLHDSEFLFVHHLELEVLLKSRDTTYLDPFSSVFLAHVIWLFLYHPDDL